MRSFAPGAAQHRSLVPELVDMYEMAAFGSWFYTSEGILHYYTRRPLWLFVQIGL